MEQEASSCNLWLCQVDACIVAPHILQKDASTHASAHGAVSTGAGDHIQAITECQCRHDHVKLASLLNASCSRFTHRPYGMMQHEDTRWWSWMQRNGESLVARLLCTSPLIDSFLVDKQSQSKGASLGPKNVMR